MYKRQLREKGCLTYLKRETLLGETGRSEESQATVYQKHRSMLS
ncbi:hypothetical protein JMUB7516_27340 [Staphylococcus aureus]